MEFPQDRLLDGGSERPGQSRADHGPSSLVSPLPKQGVVHHRLPGHGDEDQIRTESPDLEGVGILRGKAAAAVQYIEQLLRMAPHVGVAGPQELQRLPPRLRNRAGQGVTPDSPVTLSWTGAPPEEGSAPRAHLAFARTLR